MMTMVTMMITTINTKNDDNNGNNDYYNDKTLIGINLWLFSDEAVCHLIIFI